MAELKDSLGGGEILQLALAEILQIGVADQGLDRLRHQDLSAVTGIHEPRAAVQRRSEIVAVTLFGLSHMDTHPDRKLEISLGDLRGCERGARRREDRAHSIARVLEHRTTRLLHDSIQRLVMNRQCG